MRERRIGQNRKNQKDQKDHKNQKNQRNRELRQVAGKNRGQVSCFMLLGIVIAFLANYKADCYQRVIDGLTDGGLRAGTLAVYGAVLAAGYLFSYLEEYPYRKLNEGLYLDFKLLALEKISRIDYQACQRLGTGELTQRIETGAAAGRDILFGFWFRTLRELLPTIGFGLFFIWRISREMTAAILCGYAAVYLTSWALLKVLYRMKERLLSNQERLNHFLVRGLMEMVVFRMERRFPAEIGKARQAKKEIVDTQAKLGMIHEAFFVIFALIVAALELGVLAYAWLAGSVSVGQAVALISLMNNVYSPIAIFNVLLVQYRLDRAAYGRLEEFLQAPEDGRLERGRDVDRLSGQIRVEGLDFDYAGRRIFRNLNLSIQPGQKVALVGESGSGKSTLAKLLCGLLKYEAGSIRLDGMELHDIRLNSLYERLGYISQDAPVFDGTLRENLDFGEAAPEAELRAAMARARFLSVCDQLPEGLETRLGERGVLLSGGEKQRAALARLFLEQKDLIILDEATSAMDNLTEEAVIGEIFSHWKEKTVICVAHRLNAVRGCDRVIAMKDGRIVGDGSFEELLENNAYFRKLYEAGNAQEKAGEAIDSIADRCYN